MERKIIMATEAMADGIKEPRAGSKFDFTRRQQKLSATMMLNPDGIRRTGLSNSWHNSCITANHYRLKLL